MKRIMKLSVFVIAIMMSLCASAQLDTAWMRIGFGDNYINPPLIDPACETYFCSDSLWVANAQICGTSIDPVKRVISVAQKFDLGEETLKLRGVALYASGNGKIQTESGLVEYRDSLKVGILNSKREVIYEQIFISGGFQDGNSHPEIIFNPRFIECFFDSIVTIREYDSYYAFVQPLELPCGETSEENRMVFTSIIMYALRSGNQGVSCGYGAKYKAIGFTCANYDTWFNAEEEALKINSRYYAGNVSCDTGVYAPAGIFPIKYEEDTSGVGLANVELGADAVTLYPNPTRSGEVTVEAAENILSVEIYDIANRLVRCESTNAKSVRLNLSALSSGTYLAKVRTESGTVTRKFIIE